MTENGRPDELPQDADYRLRIEHVSSVGRNGKEASIDSCVFGSPEGDDADTRGLYVFGEKRQVEPFKLCYFVPLEGGIQR